MPRRHISRLLAVTLALLGCEASVESPVVPDGVAPAPAPAVPLPPAAEGKPLEIAWASCTIPSGQLEYEADCATVELPARRGMADLGTVPVAVYRLKARKQPATAQMWFLNGGPGGSGFSLVRYADRVASSFAQGVDTYLIDHRGTGESTFLECPKATRASKDLDAFAVECSQEIRELSGDKLDGFGTTESAHDVRELIDATAEPDKKVVVYGGSYGSYWAHRLLQLPNVHVDAVITDGNCLSSTCTFDTPQSFGMDEVVKNIAEVCKEQEACRARFGPDPWGKIRDIVRKLNEGHCAEAALAQMAPADLILNLGPMWAAGILPLLYRLDRCSAGDLAALGALAGVFTRIDQGSRANATVDVVPSDQFLRRIPRLGETPAPTSRTSFSTALQTHVVASELV